MSQSLLRDRLKNVTKPGFHGLAKRFFVHEADHQDAVGLVILDDGRHQAALLAEIEIPCVDTNKKARQLIGGRSFNFRN